MEFCFLPYDPAQKDVLLQVRSLMEEAFPPSERRAWGDFEQLLASESRFTFSLLYQGKTLLGFFSLWNLGSFFYGEHFALFPSCRGGGRGQIFLEKICDFVRERGKPLVLEVEHPVDTLTERRLNFYLRNSFMLLSRDYVQPAYGANYPEVPMYLLGTSSVEEHLIPNYVACIKEAVYVRN